jgi:valyl-tRNA synthetase
MAIFTPYLATELLQYLPTDPKIQLDNFINNDLEMKISDLLEVCKNIRELKAHLKVTKKSKCEIVIFTDSEKKKNFLIEYKKHLERLTFSNEIKITSKSEEFKDFSATSTAGHICSLGIKLEDNLDKSKNLQFLNKKKLDKLENEIKNMMSIVNNEGYREKASEKVQKKHQERIEKLKAEIENIKKMEGN